MTSVNNFAPLVEKSECMTGLFSFDEETVRVAAGLGPKHWEDEGEEEGDKGQADDGQPLALPNVVCAAAGAMGTPQADVASSLGRLRQ